MINYKLLIVDDEASIRHGISSAIDWHQYNITIVGTAKNSREALEIIQTKRPHIVLTDIQMPGKSGLDLIEETLQLGLKTRFIIISGYEDFSYAQRAITYKVASYLLKPIKTKQLIDEICKVLSQLQQDDSKLETSLKANLGQKALEERFLNRLIDVKPIDVATTRAEFSDLTLSGPFDHIRALVCRHHLPNHGSKGQFTQSDTELLHFANHNILMEVFNGLPISSFIRSAEESVAIIPADALEEGQLIALCQSFQKAVQINTGLTLLLGIGKPVPTLSDLSDSYKSGVEAMDYILYKSDRHIFLHRELDNTGSQRPQVNDMDSTAIMDAILRMDDEAIEEETKAFLQRLFFIPEPPPTYIKGMCTYLVMDIQRKLTSYGIQDDFSRGLKETIDVDKSYQAIETWIIRAFVTLSKELADSNPLLSDPAILQTKAYLQSHIDKKILLKDVAKEVHLSENYLAKLFKKKTSHSFRDYVLNLKMDAAKTLLIKSNKTISQVACEVGYNDYRSFNRVFKNIVGQTPSDFQAQYRKG